MYKQAVYRKRLINQQCCDLVYRSDQTIPHHAEHVRWISLPAPYLLENHQMWIRSHVSIRCESDPMYPYTQTINEGEILYLEFRRRQISLSACGDVIRFQRRSCGKHERDRKIRLLEWETPLMKVKSTCSQWTAFCTHLLMLKHVLLTSGQRLESHPCTALIQ